MRRGVRSTSSRALTAFAIDSDAVPLTRVPSSASTGIAITAIYRPHGYRIMSEIVTQEASVAANGRYRFSLRLWPFQQFAVECAEVSIQVKASLDRGRVQPGRFAFKST